MKQASKYEFRETGAIILNSKHLKVYDVYENVEECECPGVTVVTSTADVFCDRIYAKNLKEAKEEFYMKD